MQLRRFARNVDRALCANNAEYEAKRASQRLGPPVVRRVAAGSYQKLRQQRVAAGAPEAQVKIPQLSPSLRFGEQLEVVDEIPAEASCSVTGHTRPGEAFARTALLAWPHSVGAAPTGLAGNHPRAMPAGTTILRQGDTSMAVYVILSGRVAVQIGAQVVREIGADGFFGELGVIDDAPRSATHRGTRADRCALLGAWDVRGNPRIALGLLPILAQRLREAQRARATHRGGVARRREWRRAVRSVPPHV